VSLHYGKYQWCGITSTWGAFVIYPNGYYTSADISSFSGNNCGPVSAGVWERNSGSGNHYTNGGGVNIYGLIGINLSIDTNYDQNHIMYYRLASAGRICGDNAVPSLASNVNTTR
jgi:hypothetical protein